MLALASRVSLAFADNADNADAPLWAGPLDEFLADNADALDLEPDQIRAGLARDGAVHLGGGAAPLFVLAVSLT
jgi:hypothetical protein